MTNETAPVKVRKNTGELVDFDPDKLRDALARSGAKPAQVEEVLKKITPSLYDGISTHKIYQLAYAVLKKSSFRAAGRYKLKKAMLELGPTGYPFEHFVAKLLHYQGYEVLVGQIIQGRCVTHEVDVVATKPGKKVLVECKYHGERSAKSDVKVPLYIHSRFLDVKGRWEETDADQSVNYECMLVTNSRFTQDALDYGTCAGLNMVSWDTPVGNSLKDWIDRSGYHPLTVLQSLKKSEKEALLKKDIVLCRQISENPEILNDIVYPAKRIEKVKKEIHSLL